MLDQARKDGLTGFWEREELEPYLRHLIEDAQAAGQSFCLALLDIDHFKRFNDKYGHLFGDEILKYATSTLRLTFFEGQCILFRYGGDEFIAIFPQKNIKEAMPLLRQCHYNLRHRPCLYENRFYRVTISSGIVAFPDEAKTAGALIEKADVAMYFSKKSGRNRSTYFARMGLLRLRRILTFWGFILAVVVALFIVYRLTYQALIRPKLGQLRHMKIVSTPEDLDKIILRDGLVFEGWIVTENRREIAIRLYFEGGGEGQMTIRRSEISQIQYGRKKEEQDK